MSSIYSCVCNFWRLELNIYGFMLCMYACAFIMTGQFKSWFFYFWSERCPFFTESDCVLIVQAKAPGQMSANFFSLYLALIWFGSLYRSPETFACMRMANYYSLSIKQQQLKYLNISHIGQKLLIFIWWSMPMHFCQINS